MRNGSNIPIVVQAVTLLAACVSTAMISFLVTWAFFETLGTWRWPL